MKVKGAITLLVGFDSTEISVKDRDANVSFCKISLTPEQLSAALSRQSYVDCEIELYGLEKLGKIHENQKFDFEITGINKSDDIALFEAANRALVEKEMAEWVPDKYFRSQNSFFKKDGKDFARCTIRRWV